MGLGALVVLVNSASAQTLDSNRQYTLIMSGSNLLFIVLYQSLLIDGNPGVEAKDKHAVRRNALAGILWAETQQWIIYGMIFCGAGFNRLIVSGKYEMAGSIYSSLGAATMVAIKFLYHFLHDNPIHCAVIPLYIILMCFLLVQPFIKQHPFLLSLGLTIGLTILWLVQAFLELMATWKSTLANTENSGLLTTSP